MADEFVCPYCAKELDESKATEEHIWPDSLGGELAGDTLITKACSTCNSRCGLYVDGAFLRSWLVKNDVAQAARQFLDLDAGTPMPLLYMGVLDGFDPSPYTTAELWLAPCRGRVLHLHSHADEKFLGQAGGNPIERKRNRGTAIFFNGTKDERWARVDLRSFHKAFKKERRFVYGVEFSSASDVDAFGSTPDAEHSDVASRFVALDPGPFNFKLAADLDFDERFLAKLGLGLGAKYLGDSYITSARAGVLRTTLWPGSREAQAQLPRIGWGMLDDAAGRRVARVKWPGGITIALMSVGEMVVATVDVFGRGITVLVSDEPALWSDRADIVDGLVWVLVPQVSLGVGPLRLLDFMGHTAGHAEVEGLVNIERLRRTPPTPSTPSA